MVLGWDPVSHRAGAHLKKLQGELQTDRWLVGVSIHRDCGAQVAVTSSPCGNMVHLLGLKGPKYGIVIPVGDLDPLKSPSYYIHICYDLLSACELQLHNLQVPRTDGSSQICFPWIIKVNSQCNCIHHLLGQDRSFLHETLLCPPLCIAQQSL